MTEYHFNAELAKRYGVNGAIFLHAMAFWVAKNQANGRHFHEGRTWTYNTLDALTRLFPFWSRRQVERITAKLREEGALLTGNFNEDKTDRTMWYALSDSVLEIYRLAENSNSPDCDMDVPEGIDAVAPISPNSDMDIPKQGDPCHKTGKCNKETVTDQLYYTPLPPKGGRESKQEERETVRTLLAQYAGEDKEMAQALDDLMEVRAAKKAVDSPRAIVTLLNTLDKLGGGSRGIKLQIIRQSVTNSWKSVFPLKGGAPSSSGQVAAREEVPTW